MDFFTNAFNLLGSGVTSYILAREVCYRETRLNLIASLLIGEIDTLPLLQTLRHRAIAQEDSWLAGQLTAHIKDEKRHARILTQMLRHYGQELIDPLPPQFKDKQPKAFFDVYLQGYSPEELRPENIDWLVFMGSAYTLELDAHRDFSRMAKTISTEDGASRAVKKGLWSIAQDEARHAAYLYAAMQRRLSPPEVDSLVDEWRERKVRALWAAIGDNLQHRDKPPSLVRPRKQLAISQEENPRIVA